MKAKTRFAAAVLVLVTSLNAVFAQVGGGGFGGASPYPVVAPIIDPTTGLPIPQPLPEWKDPNWKDPEKVLRQVVYDNLPVSEVVSDLRQQFTNDFDVLVPGGWSNPQDPNSQLDLNSCQVNLRLKNVSASEIFNAMNLQFEAENSPLRWKLLMNGRRQMALLRVVPELVPPAQPPRIDP